MSKKKPCKMRNGHQSFADWFINLTRKNQPKQSNNFIVPLGKKALIKMIVGFR